MVKKVALDQGLHATFMPKPIFGVNGSGMHTHQSLLTNDGENAFYDTNAELQLSKTALHYIGGILEHAPAFVAITNPLVNSYKRLVPGFEAPINIAWSEKNRSPLVRVPAKRGMSTRCEVRVPDPSCNPYLALAVMLAAGLDGVENQIDPGDPVNKNIFTMSEREKRRLQASGSSRRTSPKPWTTWRRTRWSGRPGRATSWRTTWGQAPGVGGLHLPRAPVGAGAVPGSVLSRSPSGMSFTWPSPSFEGAGAFSFPRLTRCQ